MKGLGMANIKNVWVLSGDEDGIEMRVGIFRRKKGKRKIERRYEKRSWKWNEN